MKKNKQKKQNKPNYFQQNIERDGEDWLDKKNAQDIKRDYQRIIKDMVFAGPDIIETIEPYFENRMFIENLIAAAMNEYQERWFITTSCTFFLNANQQNPATFQIPSHIPVGDYMARATNRYDAYVIIIQSLNNILNILNTGNDHMWVYTNISAALRTMGSSLYKYRFDI